MNRQGLATKGDLDAISEVLCCRIIHLAHLELIKRIRKKSLMNIHIYIYVFPNNLWSDDQETYECRQNHL